MRSKALWVLVALVAVLGITTAASATGRPVISGVMIKDHTIDSKNLVDHTIRAHDMSQALVASFEGIAGHQVVSRTFSISPGQIVTGSAIVPDGKVVLSGGVQPGAPTELTILGSYPSLDGTSWTVIVRERSDSPAATTFKVYAVAGRALSSYRTGEGVYTPPASAVRPGLQP